MVAVMSKRPFHPNGLNPLTFNKRLRWRVDQDYFDKLRTETKSCSPERAEIIREGLDFISRYNQEAYAGVGLYENDCLHTDPTHRKELSKERYRNDADSFSFADAEKLMDRDELYPGQATDANFDRSKPMHLRFEERPPEPVKILTREEIEGLKK
jgi:hypothetical protein